MPFYQQPVSCLKRGPQGCSWHRSREVALSLSVGFGSSWGSVLCSQWAMMPARHGQCGLGGGVADGAWGAHSYRTWSCLPGHREILGNLLSECQGTWQAAAAGTGASAGAQSRKKMTRAAERRTEKGLHQLCLRLHLVSWQGNSQRIFFWSPSYPERLEADMATTSFCPCSRSKCCDSCLSPAR